MMNSINKFNEIVEYIETHLDSQLDINLLAKKAGLSLYEFRRIFSFIAGIPISEYIRKRRMSRAAEDLLSGNESITELAIKYGYDAPSSFSRAFKEFHGITPNEIGKSDCCLNMFTPIEFETRISGGADISYTLKKDSDFYICGISQLSEMSDTECCEDAWSAFYDSAYADEILDNCNDNLYACYTNGINNVECIIGARAYENDRLFKVHIPQSLWMCFKFHGSDDTKVNEFYKNVLYRCIRASSYEKDNSLPNIEVFPRNTDDDNFEWEVRIAVKKKQM